jgi:transposase
MQAARPPQSQQEQLNRLRQLEDENRRLQREVEQARFKNKRLKERIERLEQDLEKAHRAIHRQAAPFSKGEPKAEPKQPGRRAGSDYGEPFFRPVPQRVDEVLSAPGSRRCPCGGTVQVERTEPQYQEDIVRRTVVRRFDIEVGHCQCCGARTQGRHPLQTSDALGAAKVQVGPEALVLGAQLNKQMGLSLGHTTRVLQSGYGLEFSRGGIYKALARLAGKAEPTYQGLLVTARQSLVNWVDETGWRVGGHSQWLWVAESERVTVYSILPGRGSEQLKQILGADYDGWLVHDGLRCYSSLDKASHQTCLTHLIRRCKEMAERATQAAAWFPLQVKTLLQQALLLGDRYELQQVTPHGLAVATGRLAAAMDRLLDKTYHTASNKRLAKHLCQQREYLFTFLHCPGLEGTNCRAERAVRPAVIARKVWGGNRTWSGANVQQILMSVLRTFHQQGKDAFVSLVELLRLPGQKILEIVPTPA